MQHGVTQGVVFERIHQRLQLHTAHAYPLGQGRARQCHAGTGKDAFLAVQQVSVFGRNRQLTVGDFLVTTGNFCQQALNDVAQLLRIQI
jgi:hypothetical protein